MGLRLILTQACFFWLQDENENEYMVKNKYLLTECSIDDIVLNERRIMP